jgi:hypothetical protein
VLWIVITLQKRLEPSPGPSGGPDGPAGAQRDGDSGGAGEVTR